MDFHIHSQYSFDCQSSLSDILSYARKNSLDGIAITDHETMQGVLKIKRFNPEILVIAGMEVNTEYGDVVGLFLNEEIKSKKFFEVVDEIKSQDGIIVLPHPYRGHKQLSEISKKVDVFEVLNGRSRITQNLKSSYLAKKSGKGVVAGSDAHTLSEIGNTVCSSSSLDEDNLRREIINGDLQVKGYLNSMRYTLKWGVKKWMHQK